MKTFEVKKRRLVTAVIDDWYEIQAETKEEAIEKLKTDLLILDPFCTDEDFVETHEIDYEAEEKQ
jgi:t-SNARE complex subunit (syntaxin)